MGALIAAAAPRGLRAPEEANLVSPEIVVSVHVAYIQAGAELIETNTFGANRAKLAAQFLDDDVERINSDGVKLAREAREMSGADVLISGSIGPLGDGAIVVDRAAVYAEQAAALAARGVDLFTVETFHELDGADDRDRSGAQRVEPADRRAADVRRGRRDAGRRRRGRGGGGDARARRRGVRCEPRRRTAGGADGARGDGRRRCRSRRCRTSVSRAAGATGSSIRTRTRSTSATSRHRRASSARGSSAAAAARRRFRSRRSATRSPRSARVAQPIFSREREQHTRAIPTHEESRFAAALREGRFAATVEINPPKGGSIDGLLDLCRALRDSGKVGYLDVTDNYTARARMNPMMASAAIEQQVGIETIPHLTPRDSSVMGLESILLGAHAAGLRNVLAITGDPPDVGDYPGSHGVYEVDSIGLCRLLQKLNAGESFTGKALDAPTSFFYGVAVNPTADDLDEELRRFEQKIEAGAQFAITQSLFDLAYLDELERRLGGWPIPVLLGVFYVTSYPLALRLHNEVPGIVVPEAVRERFRAAGTDAAQVGFEIAQELIAEAQGRVAGVEVIPPFKAPLAALELLPDPQPPQEPVETASRAEATARRTTESGTP